MRMTARHGATRESWFGRGQDAQGALRTVWMPDDYIIGYPDYYVQSVERHPMDYLWASLATRNWHRGFIGVECWHPRIQLKVGHGGFLLRSVNCGSIAHNFDILFLLFGIALGSTPEFFDNGYR